MIPGEYFIKDGEIELNKGRKGLTLTVSNTGDGPIQVGSHYHFSETNPALRFDRKKARGMRLDIPAGTAVRFEPGQTRDVKLVALAGTRTVYGFRQEIMGKLEKGKLQESRRASLRKPARHVLSAATAAGTRIKSAFGATLVAASTPTNLTLAISLIWWNQTRAI